MFSAGQTDTSLGRGFNVISSNSGNNFTGRLKSPGKTTHFMTYESLIVHLYGRKLSFSSCSEQTMFAKHQDSREELEENNSADFICSFENLLTYIFPKKLSLFYYNRS